MMYKVTLLWLVASLSTLFAQTTFQEQTARLQNINAYLLDLRPQAAPGSGSSHWLLSFELTPQPDVDTRVGNKDEPIDPPSVVPRVRLRYRTNMGLFVGATYVPGLEFQDYEADYYALELGWGRRLGPWALALRGSIGDGDVTGPITEEGVEDFFTFENNGVDLSLGRRVGPVRLYGFAGRGATETSLEVQSDGVRLAQDDDTAYGGLGLSWRLHKWELVLEQNFTDDYLKHVTASVGYRF